MSADGHCVVSHAGMGMLRELADRAGLSAQLTAALADIYRGQWVYAPGEVFTDLAVAIADGPTASTGSARCAATVSTCSGPRPRRPRCGGSSISASTPRTWLHIDIDVTLVIDHSDNKIGAAPTWNKTYGHHPLLAFLDRPEIADAEALAGLLRNGNAGSNTAPITSSCSLGHWPLSRSRGGPTLPVAMIRTDRRCWCAAIPPGPPAFVADTPTGIVAVQVAGLELCHRHHDPSRSMSSVFYCALPNGRVSGRERGV